VLAPHVLHACCVAEGHAKRVLAGDGHDLTCVHYVIQMTRTTNGGHSEATATPRLQAACSLVQRLSQHKHAPPHGPSHGSHSCAALQDPYCTALTDTTDAEQVKASSAAGNLPPVKLHMQLANGEFIEFDQVTAESRLERRAQGWLLRPVVWFRWVGPG
jgi:hypothetical protein